MSEPENICGKSGDGKPKEIRSVQELVEISGEQHGNATERNMQNRVGTSEEQSGAAGFVGNSSIYENTRTLKDLVQLLAIKITAESFAKIIPEFDGESTPVKHWFDNFEMNAAAYDLNIKQMYVQARAKMTNTAKLFLDSTYVNQYSEMRMLLETEFSRQYVCSADVHGQLRDRKKLKQESFHEYLLQMKKMASLGNIDACSVNRYVVDGLNMKSDFRYSLYSCKSYKELQEQYEVFDRVVEKAIEGKWTSNQRKKHEFNDRKSHCFNCGSVDHLLKYCKAAVKCFNCNEEGHMSRDCHESAAVIQVVRSTIRMKVITINNMGIECLVDTGADVSIIRKFIFNKISNVVLERGATKLRGLGKRITRPVGYFLAEVAVDQQMTSHKFVVVEDEDIEYDALLGFDFISKFDFSLSADGYKFSSPLVEKACVDPNQMSIYNIIETDDKTDVPPQYAKEASICRMRELRKAQICEVKTKKAVAKKDRQLLQRKLTYDEVVARRKKSAYLRMCEFQKLAKDLKPIKIKSKEGDILQKTNHDATLDKWNAQKRSFVEDQASLGYKNNATWIKCEACKKLADQRTDLSQKKLEKLKPQQRKRKDGNFEIEDAQESIKENIERTFDKDTEVDWVIWD